jgi:adenylate cyclase
MALYEFAVGRDPANPLRHNDLGVAHYYAGHWDPAIASLRTAVTLSPGLIGANYTMGQALLMKGQAAEALVAMQAESDEVGRLEGISLALHTLGRAAESDAALNTVIKRHARDQAAWIAVTHAWRGEVDRAFEWLDRAASSQELLDWIILEPMFASLHDDPRWLALLRKLGRAPEQLAAIKFDVPLPN